MSEQQARMLEEGFDPLAIAQTPSPWQQVLHGNTRTYRYAVTEWLVKNNRGERAVGFAMCGMGDKAIAVDEGIRVQPKRCGHPACPRCSRYRGLKFLRRVQDYLRTLPHGPIFHIVLTQQVDETETLGAARERFERRFSSWMKRYRERMGMHAGLAVTHMSWSMSVEGGGWHYHQHLVLESNLPAELAERRCRFAADVWAEIKKDDGDTRAQSAFVRCVSGGGQPLEGLDEGTGDLWVESNDEVTKCVQYVARDVCQGVESWNVESATGRVAELCEVVRSAKLRRLYGAWRTPLPAEEVKPAKEANADGPKVFDDDAQELGRVDDVLFAAGRGEEWGIEAALGLLASSRNNSAVGKRLVAVVGRFVHHTCPAVLVA